jgi:hypothetical protein
MTFPTTPAKRAVKALLTLTSFLVEERISFQRRASIQALKIFKSAAPIAHPQLTWAKESKIFRGFVRVKRI